MSTVDTDKPMYKSITHMHTHTPLHILMYACLGLFMHRTFWKKELTVVKYGKKKMEVRGRFTYYILCHLSKLLEFLP